MSKKIDEYIEEIKIIDSEVIALYEELRIITEGEEFNQYVDTRKEKYIEIHKKEKLITDLGEDREDNREYIELLETALAMAKEEKEIVSVLIEREQEKEREREQGRGDL